MVCNSEAAYISLSIFNHIIPSKVIYCRKRYIIKCHYMCIKYNNYIGSTSIYYNTGYGKK